MAPSFFRRLVAGALVLTMTVLFANLPVVADSNAVLRGRVLEGDGVNPRPGVVVTLVDESSRKTYDSAPADARGFFRVDSAPAGTYAVVARASEGAFLAADSVKLMAGENKPLALALKANATAPASPTEKTRSDEMSSWLKWLIVGGIVIGGLAVANSIMQEETPSSGF